ncbi:glycosyltransferase involved in cell wall biosynthesis [Microbacterium sp. W4I4]|uniref:glycosyltransferase n=1 Tax=Microbacterium sp. W4I4 TaxID=3042295 RepID=UPI002781A22F|nr:glycosyltransferase [Microbacterium sp. W4I4]MDQ0613778.1 glycosyltransferase involved in cell wall biosynthesis [Microbacterium sp. W4I4]
MTGLLVHEWIERSGGAERVLDAMAAAFPDAGIQCLWNDAPERYADRTVRETWLARTPLRRHKALALPFMPATWRRLSDGDEYEWMLISSHLFAHHARPRDSGTPKYVYAHTPARYIWSPELDERGSSAVVRAVAPAYRRLDRTRAQEATAIAANSRFVRDRIARTWDRDATVIHPPVVTERILSTPDWRTSVTDDAERRMLEQLPPVFVLGASRFIPYKRLDLVIRSAARADLPAVIAGSGPDEARLRAVATDAGVPVMFVISPSDALLYALMQQASAFVFPAVEDFGIIPVEAQAAGTPVVTGPVGGQRETFTDGVSGVAAASTGPGDLATAISAAMDLPPFIAANVVAPFSESVFVDKIKNFVLGR